MTVRPVRLVMSLLAPEAAAPGCASTAGSGCTGTTKADTTTVPLVMLLPLRLVEVYTTDRWKLDHHLVVQIG